MRRGKMADFITRAQYKKLKANHMLNDTTEFNKILKEYTGIEATPYTSYLYFDSNGNYVGDSNETDLDELLEAAYVEVRDG